MQPERPTPAYYLVTPVGVWLFATAVLLFGSVRALARAAEPGGLFVVTCGVLHVAFVCFLFGNQWSWIYYPVFPFLGAAVAIDRASGSQDESAARTWPWKLAGWVLAVWLVVVALAWVGVGCARAWSGGERSPLTAGLFASTPNRQAWSEVRRVAEKEPVFVLTRMGCAPLLTPGLEGPRSWCLIRAVATPEEMSWVCDRLQMVSWVLVPNWHDNNLVEWPEFKELMRAFRPVIKSPWFTLYKRTPPAPRSG